MESADQLRAESDALWRELDWTVRRREPARVETVWHTSRLPAARATLRLAADVDAVARVVIDEVLQSSPEWNPSFAGGRVVEPGEETRVLEMRTALPFPFQDRVDRFAQHRFEEEGIRWEISRAVDEPLPATPGARPARIHLATKSVRPDGEGCQLRVLWIYDLGGFFRWLPRAALERMIGDSLARECALLAARFNQS